MPAMFFISPPSDSSRLCFVLCIRSVEAAAAAAAAAAVAGGTGRSPHGCRTSEVASATPFFWYCEVLVGTVKC